MKKHVFALSALLLWACNTTPPEFTPSVNFVPAPRITIYQANYEYTWKAAMAEMQRYPLSIVNREAGTITTDNIIAISDRYETPNVISNLEPRSEVKFYIDVRIRELPPVNNIPQTEVSVIKYITQLTQLGGPRPLKSDYLDEKVILYRIKRLLELERLKLERNRK
ncbi:MAG: hypothetical protein NTY22_05225 [Proteobacteria bacterium]|nr:hypothetical protein [Pseudomonadota bacterium]